MYSSSKYSTSVRTVMNNKINTSLEQYNQEMNNSFSVKFNKVLAEKNLLEKTNSYIKTRDSLFPKDKDWSSSLLKLQDKNGKSVKTCTAWLKTNCISVNDPERNNLAYSKEYSSFLDKNYDFIDAYFSEALSVLKNNPDSKILICMNKDSNSLCSQNLSYFPTFLFTASDYIRYEYLKWDYEKANSLLSKIIEYIDLTKSRTDDLFDILLTRAGISATLQNNVFINGTKSIVSIQNKVKLLALLTKYYTPSKTDVVRIDKKTWIAMINSSYYGEYSNIDNNLLHSLVIEYSDIDNTLLHSLVITKLIDLENTDDDSNLTTTIKMLTIWFLFPSLNLDYISDSLVSAMKKSEIKAVSDLENQNKETQDYLDNLK